MSQATARRYAIALHEIIKAKSNIDLLNKQVRELLELLTDNDQLADAISSPIFQSKEKEKLIVSVFSDKIDGLLTNFLLFLIRKRRIGLSKLILSEYLLLLDEKSGKINSEIISAVQLSQKQLDKIKEFLQKNISEKINISNTIDTSLMGGYQIKIGDLIVDQSIKNHMQKLKASLLAS